MAAANPSDALDAAAKWPIFLNRTYKIMTARRVKAAVPAENRPQKDLVQPNRLDQEPTGQAPQPFDQKTDNIHGGES